MPYPSATLYPRTSLLPGGEAVATVIPVRTTPDRPHLAFPFERGADGKVNVVEQDTVEHVDACANIIVRCPLGFRLERPEFGWPFPEFQAIPLDLGALREALTRLEPRGVPDISQYTDAAEAAVQRVQITEGVVT